MKSLSWFKFLVVAIFVLVINSGTSLPVVFAQRVGAEKITLDTPHSYNIRKFNLTINLPSGYQLVNIADPHVLLHTKGSGLLRQFSLTAGKNSFVLNERVDANILYAELMLYYCTPKQQQKGICITKNVIFEIPLDTKLKPANLDLSYTIPEAKE